MSWTGLAMPSNPKPASAPMKALLAAVMPDPAAKRARPKANNRSLRSPRPTSETTNGTIKPASQRADTNNPA